MTRIASSPSVLSLIPKCLKESTHCINAATTKFNSERLPGMDSARPGEVIAFENCVYVMRVPSPILHMQEGVVQFEQWRPWQRPRGITGTKRYRLANHLTSPCSQNFVKLVWFSPRIRTLFSWLSVSLCHCTQNFWMLSDDPSRLTVNTIRWHGRNCLEERLRLPGVMTDNKVFPMFPAVQFATAHTASSIQSTDIERFRARFFHDQFSALNIPETMTITRQRR